MRVQGTTAKTSSSTKRVARSRGFALGQGVDRATAAPAGSLGMLASIDALTALQGVDEIADAGEVRAQGVARGNGMLGDLERLRDGLLADDLDDAAAGDLRRRLRERRASTTDAALADILDAIELRAEVELAKRERAANEPDAGPSAPSVAEVERLARQAYARR
jgi:hypothetical protein